MARNQDVEELVVKNDNGGVAVEAEGLSVGRVAWAEGMRQPSKELLERYESMLDVYTAKFKERMDRNIDKAHELAKLAKSGVKTEFGEPITYNFFGLYKWWDLYVIGPFQSISTTARPNKIIAGGETVSFVVFVVTNPENIDGINPPSAQQIMAGRRYRLRLETFNLTNGGPGYWTQITRSFPGTTPVQAFVLSLNIPAPLQGRPELMEINVTADVLDAYQPMAAFATTIFDVDQDPGFPTLPPQGSHLHIEQPLRCLCYRK